MRLASSEDAANVLLRRGLTCGTTSAWFVISGEETPPASSLTPRSVACTDGASNRNAAATKLSIFIVLLLCAAKPKSVPTRMEVDVEKRAAQVFVPFAQLSGTEKLGSCVVQICEETAQLVAECGRSVGTSGYANFGAQNSMHYLCWKVSLHWPAASQGLNAIFWTLCYRIGA